MKNPNAIFICSLITIMILLVFASKAKACSDEEAISYLALNAYFEGIGSGVEEMFAISTVVMNRVEASGFPDNPCEVITQPSRISWKPWLCQFSWTCDGRPDVPKYGHDYKVALSVAHSVYYDGYRHAGIGNSTLYHAKYVRPKWDYGKLTQVAVLDHKYYEEIK